MKSLFTVKVLLICSIFLGSSLSAIAKEETSEGGKKDLKTEIKEYIDHHLKDSHDFSIFSYTEDNGEHVYVGVPLPVILWDNGRPCFFFFSISSR